MRVTRYIHQRFNMAEQRAVPVGDFRQRATLERATALALSYLSSLDAAPVGATASLSELRRRGGADGVADQDAGSPQPVELFGAGETAGEVRGDRPGQWRIAGHQPVDAVRLSGRQLELFSDVFVIHARF